MGFSAIPIKDSKQTTFRLFGSKVSPVTFLAVAAIEGVSFHFGQSAEDTTLLRLFNKKKGGFYIDIGAFHPRKYSNTYMLHRFFGWTGINVDASAEAIALFELERPEDINVHSAVGDIASETVLWKFDYPARNTISEENVQRQLLKGDATVIGKESVLMRPLANILAEYMPMERAIDLLNIDVEGLELQVLKSNDWGKYQPQVILVEDYSIKTDGLENSEIYCFLKDIGYRFISHNFDTSIYVEKNFLLQDQKISIDVVSVNKEQHAALTDSSIIETSEIYQRSAILAKAHPESKKLFEMVQEQKLSYQLEKTEKQLSDLCEKLRTKREENKELTALLKKREVEVKEAKDNNQKIIRERNLLKRRYLAIERSRTWRYTLPARKLAVFFKRVIRSLSS